MQAVLILCSRIVQYKCKYKYFISFAGFSPNIFWSWLTECLVIYLYLSEIFNRFRASQTLVLRYFFFYWHPSTFHGLKCYKSDGNVYLIKVPQCKISIFSENHSPLILSQSCLDISNISSQLKTWLIKNYDKARVRKG